MLWHYVASVYALLIYVIFVTGNIGGIISLCLGLNLINLCEIFYVVIKMVGNYITHMFDK